MLRRKPLSLMVATGLRFCCGVRRRSIGHEFRARHNSEVSLTSFLPTISYASVRDDSAAFTVQVQLPSSSQFKTAS
jgi:hypothetical protein